MRNKYLILLSAALCACTVQLPEIAVTTATDLVPMTFTGLQDNAGITKTSLGGDYSIRWSNSDAITVFSTTGEAGEAFNVESTENDGAVATFSGLTPVTSNDYY